MKLIDCRRCGSKELVEQDGFLVCEYCQSRFVPEAVEAPVAKTTIGVRADVEALLEKCRKSPRNAPRYASLVLELDPTNAEALQYLRPRGKR